MLKCPANAYSGPGERIIEFSFPSSRGGLIALREPIGATVDDGTQARVEVYRIDGDVQVIAPKRLYWAAYAGSATDSGITLHLTEREALEAVVGALGLDFAPEDTPQPHAETDADLYDGDRGALSTYTDEELREEIAAHCERCADDWEVSEVETP